MVEERGQWAGVSVSGDELTEARGTPDSKDPWAWQVNRMLGTGESWLGDLGGEVERSEAFCSERNLGRAGELGVWWSALLGWPTGLREHVRLLPATRYYSRVRSAWLSYEWKGSLAAWRFLGTNQRNTHARARRDCRVIFLFPTHRGTWVQREADTNFGGSGRVRIRAQFLSPVVLPIPQGASKFCKVMD